MQAKPAKVQVLFWLTTAFFIFVFQIFGTFAASIILLGDDDADIVLGLSVQAAGFLIVLLLILLLFLKKCLEKGACARLACIALAFYLYPLSLIFE